MSFKEKFIAGSQQAAEIYCASHPQWEYIIPALLIGVVVGVAVSGVTAWWLIGRIRAYSSIRL